MEKKKKNLKRFSPEQLGLRSDFHLTDFTKLKG